MAPRMGLVMESFPQNFRALVVGGSGAIGAAFVSRLQSNPRCAGVVSLHRQSLPLINFDKEETIAAAAEALAGNTSFDLIINAAGLLHSPNFMPEKRISDLNYDQMLETFRINAFAPALILRHFWKLLGSERAVIAVLSAKVGSIEDNHLGGWYSYRASKAALNMFLKTASIEIKRTKPNAIVVALHPGTVTSRLSEPFQGAKVGRSPNDAAIDMLNIIDKLLPSDTGQFYAYNGERLPW